MTEVLQIDRDAAADAVEGILSGLTQSHIRSGAYDGDSLVQTMVRHRIAGQAELAWQDIATAPKDGSWVLGFWPACSLEDQITAMRWQEGSFSDGPYWMDSGDNRDWTAPTHWMPLPSAPSTAAPFKGGIA
jgi:hypothetical protein